MSLLALLGAVLLALGLAACEPGEDAGDIAPDDVGAEEDPTDVEAQPDDAITMWHWETPPHRVDVHEEIAERFEEETGITLEQVPINFDDYQQRMLAAIEADALPDMIQVNPPTFMTLHSQDAIVPVTELFEELHAEVEFIEGGYADYEIDGEHWGIPVFGVMWPLLYREDTLSDVGLPEGPATWDELLEAAAELDGDDGMAGMGLPVSTNGNFGSQVVWGFLATNGGAIVDCTGGDETIVFDSPETVETYEFLAELAEYAPAGVENWAWAEGERATQAEQVHHIVFTGSWLPGVVDEDPELPHRYAYTPIPTRDEGMESRNTGYMRNVTVTTAAEERGVMDDVEEWLRWITEPDNHAEYLQMEPGLFMPPSEAVGDSEVWTESQMVQDYPHLIEGQQEAVDRIATIGFSNECASESAGAYEGSFVLGEVLQRIVFDDEPVEDAVAWGHAQFEDLQGELEPPE